MDSGAVLSFFDRVCVCVDGWVTGVTVATVALL